jgi:hypothetical protein
MMQSPDIGALSDSLLGEAKVPADTLLWMALAPDRTWTLPLAEACGFPGNPGETVRQTLNRLCESDFARFKEPFYTADASYRPLILQNYLKTPGRFSKLRAALAATGGALNRQTVEALAPSTAKWASLAAASAGTGAADLFDQVVEGSGSDTAAILTWIDTARPLAALLARDVDNSLDLAIRRAAQRVERLHRTKADREHLHCFLKRDEQLAAVERLLADEEHWALHLIGAGGVGKTMLVRHISSDFAAEKNLITARIDFDYLNADYPRLAPGLILWSFIQELQVYDTTGEARRSFKDASDSINTLHQKLASAPAGSARGTDDSLFRAALRLYIDGLKALLRNKDAGLAPGATPHRIVLILDTCEELAKVSLGEKAPANVLETFRILEGLRYGPPPPEGFAQEGLPALRVIFSGRRVLAQEGFGWKAQSPLEKREYLQLHEVRGFTDGEARTFLLDKVQVGEEYVDPIIERSRPEAGRVAALLHEEDESASKPEAPRCNPFDLKLYADWAKEVPPPAPEMIRTATDSQYIEQRILQRLGFDPSDSVFQTVALLGHFDQEMLSAIARDDVSGPTWEKLAAQEWTDQRLEAVKQGRETRRVLSVAPGVRTRLLAYFRDRWGLGETWQRAADYLERMTLEQPLSELSWYAFDAALRVLELSPDPKRAARWWQAVERRILGERDFEWAYQVVAYLQGNDGAARQSDEDDECTLRAAVLATYAATLLQTNSRGTLRTVWNEVREKASNHPDEEWRNRLKVRAASGSVAAYRWIGGAPSNVELENFTRTVLDPDGGPIDGDAAAAVVAAMETIVELTEQGCIAPAPPIAEMAQKLDGTAASGLRAFAWSLAGRAAAHLDRKEDSLEYFRRARANKAEKTTWLDWIPPDDLAARLDLEFARAVYPKFLSPAETLQAMGPMKAGPASLDRDRLQSIRIRMKAAQRPLVPSEIPAAPNLNASLSANAYLAVPPLAAACAEAQRKLFAYPVVDLAVQRQLEEANARIMREMRITGTRTFPVLMESPHVEHREAFWALEALQGAGLRSGIPPVPAAADGEADTNRWRHAIWRTRFTLAEKKRTEAAEWAGQNMAGMEFSEPENRLDARELHRMSDPSAPPDPGSGDGPLAWWDEHPCEPERALRYWLRELALSINPESKREPGKLISMLDVSFSFPRRPGRLVISEAVLNRLGRRRAAGIAAEEGDLLAMRLPDRGATLLSLAMSWFEDCGDDQGVVTAGTALALIDVLKPRKSEFEKTFESVEKSYRELQSGNPGLPEWSVVDQRTRVEVADKAWEPWVRRLQLALSFRAQIDKPSEVLDVSELYDDLSSGYRAERFPHADVHRCFTVTNIGTRPSVRLALKTHAAAWSDIGWIALGLLFSGLCVWVSIVELRLSARLLMDGGRVLHSLAGTGLDIRRWGGFGAVAYTLLVWTAILLFCQRRVRWFSKYLGLLVIAVYALALTQLAVERWFRGATEVKAFLGAPEILVWIAVLLLFYALKRIIAAQTTNGRVRIALAPDSRAEISMSRQRIQPSFDRKSEVLVRMPFGLTLRMIEDWRVRAFMPLDASSRFNPLAGPLPVNVQRVTARLRKMLFPWQRMEFVLEPGEGMHGVNWEAALAALVDVNPQHPRKHPFRFRREPEFRGHLEGRPFIRKVACLAASSIGGEICRRNWRHPFHWEILSPAGLPELCESPGNAMGWADVLHVVATAEESASGVQISFQSSYEAAKDKVPVYQARELKRLFPNLALCIVQGEIGPLPSERSEAEQRRAALARVFAADLFAQGVPGVLVLPPLDVDRATAVVQTLAKALGKRMKAPFLDARTLEQAAAEAQEAMVQLGSEGRQLKWDRAMDVCLYCVRTAALKQPKLPST